MNNPGEISHCPNCRREVNATTCRLIYEACGHNKCRICVAQEENGCLDCIAQRNKPKQIEIISPCKIKSEWAKLSLVENFQDTRHYTIEIDGNDNIQKFECPKIKIISEEIVKRPSQDQKTFSQEMASEQSNSIHSKETDEVERCNIIASKETDKLSHNNSNHIIKIKTDTGTAFQCTICKKKFQSRSGKRFHKYCDKSLKKKYKCAECDRQFVTSEHFEYHKATHQSGTLINCDQCDRKYEQRSSLERHKRRHHMKLFNFTCGECGKKYFDKDTFAAHQVTHSEQPAPFCCDTCGKRYRFSYNLTQHVMRTHIQKEPEKFSCTCGKVYLRKVTLERHRLKHKTRITCKDCGKLFFDIFNYNRHCLKHKDLEQTFHCSICKIDIIRKDNFLRHCRNFHPEANLRQMLKEQKLHLIETSVSERNIDNINKLEAPSTAQFDEEIKTNTATATKLPFAADAVRESVITFVGKLRRTEDSVEMQHQENNESISIENKTNCINNPNCIPNKTNKQTEDETIMQNSSLISSRELIIPKKQETPILIKVSQPTITPTNPIQNETGTAINHENSIIPKKKSKKSIDPADIYRRILCLDPNDEDEEDYVDDCDESVDANINQPLELPTYNLQPVKENFGETHWRKRKTLYFYNQN